MMKLNKMRTILLIAVIFLTGMTEPNTRAAYEDQGIGEQEEERKHIVFLISRDENNYEADRTIREFAKMLENEYDYKTTVILGEGERSSFHFPGLEVLSEADLLVIFTRRVALKSDQMNRIKEYIHEGRPLLGIRTANHAFSLQEEPEDGYTDWWDFVPDILGCKNRGYGSVELGTDVSIAPDAKDHPIVNNIPVNQWHSTGNVYHVAPLLDEQAEVLLHGQSGEKTEPIAWTRTTDQGGFVFYTSLGHPADFEQDAFLHLLTNAVQFLTNKG